MTNQDQQRAEVTQLRAALEKSQRVLRSTFIGRGSIGGSCQCGTKWLGDAETHEPDCLIATNAAALAASSVEAAPAIDGAAVESAERIARRLGGRFVADAPAIPEGNGETIGLAEAARDLIKALYEGQQHVGYRLDLWNCLRDALDAHEATPSVANAVGGGEGLRLSQVIAEARKSLRLVQGCLECNADDERRWAETIEWLERLA